MSTVEILEQPTDQAAFTVRRKPFEGAIVWDRDSLAPDSGVIRVDERCQREIDAMVDVLRHNRLPLELLSPDEFELPACRALMRRAKAELEEGVGFVIIDRIASERYSVDENRQLYWVLAQLIERPVAQDSQGRMVYSVQDEGKPVGNGVRPVLTAVGQPFHTDNNFNLCPPDYVALYCLRTAMQGGINSIVSFYRVYNELLEREPGLLERLHQPFLFDRQREHTEGDPMVLSHPAFESDGERLLCRFSIKQVSNGYLLAGRKPDALGERALATLESIMREPEFQREFFFEPGQIQIVDNRRCGHRRTAFTDFPEPERRRLLLRLWLRGQGRRFYNG
ncbi:MAG: TauD/TfdA family dioxygenase [Burkholderiales bacterium]|nr:TauD/TfdA family dioxygenase [Burkholderiales bacterium]